MHAAPPDDTAQRILQCARDLFLTEGAAGLSMRKVASAAGISATAIYRHYEDRQALLFAVADEGFRRFGLELYRGLEGADPMARLVLTGEGYVRFALQNPAYYRVIFMSDTRAISHFAAESQRRFRPTLQFLVDRVRECQDGGLLAAGEPHGLSLSIWAQCHGLVSLWLDGHLKSLAEPRAFEAFFLHSVRAMLRGLAP